MKAKLKLIGFEILYLVLVILASLPAHLVQFFGRRMPEDLGFDPQIETYGIDYRYNPFAYFFGVFIFVSALYFLYIWVLKNRMTRENVKGVVFKIIYVLTSLFFSYIMFMIQCIELLLFLGFDDNILPEFGQFITVFIWPVILFVFTVGIMIWTVLKKEPEKKNSGKASGGKAKTGNKESVKKTSGKGTEKSGKNTKK